MVVSRSAPEWRSSSCHYEADLDRGGASVLDIRPLLWNDGWPVAGDNLRDGTYQIESVRTGTVLELAVEGMPVGGRRERRGGPGPGGVSAGGPGAGPPPGGGGLFAGIGRPISDQDVVQVSSNWPAGEVSLRMANYLCQAQQKWSVTAVTDAGGYLGSPFFKITVANTDRALTATEEGELAGDARVHGRARTTVASRSADRRSRLQPKATPGRREPLALSAIGASFATLSKVDRQQQTPLDSESAMNPRHRNLSLTLLAVAVLSMSGLRGRTAEGIASAPTLKRSTSVESPPSSDGFIQRWWILEPIPASGLTDGAVQALVKKEHFPDQLTLLPKNGAKVISAGAELTWHAVESTEYNVNLFHFARAQGKPTSNVLFWAVTVLHCPEEVKDVRLAIGSNAEQYVLVRRHT